MKTRDSRHFWSCLTRSTREPTTRACSSTNIWRQDGPIAHVRYINIQAWLRGFRVKITNFSSFFCLLISKRDLDTKKTTPNIEVWPESLGAMSENWYIERGLFVLKIENLSRIMGPRASQDLSPCQTETQVDASWRLGSTCDFVWPGLGCTYVDLRWLTLTLVEIKLHTVWPPNPSQRKLSNVY